jgi:hypothetical protein
MCSQTTETVEAIVSQLIEKQRQSRQAALVKQLSSESCPDSTCMIGKPCLHRNNTKGSNEILKRSDSVGQVPNNFSLDSKVRIASKTILLMPNVFILP